MVSAAKAVELEPEIVADFEVGEKVTLAVATVAVYVPEFVQLLSTVMATAAVWLIAPLLPIVTEPLTLRALVTVSVDAFVPVPIVNESTVALAVTEGWFAPVKFASPMTAEFVALGTPFVQFAAVAQAVLVPPIQLVVV
jgi:hypothetical protein